MPLRSRLRRLVPRLPHLPRLPGRRPVDAGRWRSRDGRMRVFAHRGDSANHCENTIPAFEAARRSGADGVELDVRLDRDGDVVVFHDADLARLCGRPGAIEALTTVERRELRVGEGGAHAIPTLVEVIEACGDMELDIELKTPRAGRPNPLARAVAAVIERAGRPERFLISSFDPVALLQMRRHAPALARAFLFHAKQALPLRMGLPAPAIGAIAVHPEDALVTPAAVARWHARGYAINTWTVDDPVRLRALAEMGVDGVCCNDPVAALRALGR